MDAGLLGQEFFRTNKEALLKLRMSSLVQEGRVLPLNIVRRATGLNFTQNVHIHLSTAAHFAILKYGRNNNSNGRSVSMSDWMRRIKKGSGRFRNIINLVPVVPSEINQLRVVKTFFELIDFRIVDPDLTEILHSLWTCGNLSNSVRMFSFQLYNNSLGIGARMAARYRNEGIFIDQRCRFCVKGRVGVPMREDFKHLFVDCTIIHSVVDNFLSTDHMLILTSDDGSRNLLKTTGIRPGKPPIYMFFSILTALLVNFMIWQYRNRKIIPSLASLTFDVDTLFALAASGGKLAKMAENCNLSVCRRWRESGHGRG